MSNTQIAESGQSLPALGSSTTELLLRGDSLDRMFKVAEFMASSKTTLPAHFRGNPADCLAVVMQSMQWDMNPFAVAQKTHLVSGVLGYEAQLVNAVITSRAPVTGRLEYEWFGDWEKVIGKFDIKTNSEGKQYRQPGWKLEDEAGLGVSVWATFKGESQPRRLDLLLAQARTRNSTLWADDPRQQLAYLATKRWSRLYCPDVIMGVYSPDEMEESQQPRDMGAAVVVNEPEKPKTVIGIIYGDEEFAVKLGEWRGLIEAGRTTAERIIKMSASKKVALTDEQKKAIIDLEVVDA